MKTKVLGIVGPTAVGKSNLGIKIAKQFNGEIISGDAMQVYKGMDIGTAKIHPDDTGGIPHHMIDIRSPYEPFTVADFQKKAQSYIDKITCANKLPILVGGSGLYVQAVLDNYQLSGRKRDPAITNRLNAQVEDAGIEPLYEKLKQVDPQQAEKIHPNNVQRVIRALETYESTGVTMTAYQASQRASSPYDYCLIGLEMDREHLYRRINERVDKMIDEGLVQEVKSLYQSGYEYEQAMKAIGYKELIPYLKNEITLTTAKEFLKRNSRRYAKRQYTWFKNKMKVHWYNVTQDNQADIEHIIFSDLAGFIQ